MVIPKKYWFPILYGMASLFFVAGFVIWMLAHLYQPVTPPPDPPVGIPVDKGPMVYSLDRYRSLLSGRLFFGGGDFPDNLNPVVQFRSRLILWGVIKDGHAVIGLDPNSNQDTKLVKAGDVIEDETIVSIGDVYIVVKNQTGQGKIKIFGEN